MPLTRLTLLLWQYGLPFCKRAAFDLLFPFITDEAALDGNFRRLITIEERCIDLNASDSSRCNTQPNHHPIEGLGVVPASLPAIVPCACVGKYAGLVDWCGRCGEVVGGGKPFVGKREDAGAERLRYQVL